MLGCGKPAVGGVRIGAGERLHDDPLQFLLGHGSVGIDEHTRGGYGSGRIVGLDGAARCLLDILVGTGRHLTIITGQRVQR